MGFRAGWEAAHAPSGVIQEQEDADDERDSPAVWSAATKMNDGSINHRALLVNARRLVIKVGTGVVCNAENEFDPLQVAGLGSQHRRPGQCRTPGSAGQFRRGNAGRG